MEISFTYTRAGAVRSERVTMTIYSWRDETNEDDPYTLRVMRDEQGSVVAAPLLMEISDWQETP